MIPILYYCQKGQWSMMPSLPCGSTQKLLCNDTHTHIGLLLKEAMGHDDIMCPLCEVLPCVTYSFVWHIPLGCAPYVLPCMICSLLEFTMDSKNHKDREAKTSFTQSLLCQVLSPLSFSTPTPSLTPSYLGIISPLSHLHLTLSSHIQPHHPHITLAP